MVGIEKALVIGGGIGGMCAAIELRKRGVEVDLVEIDPQWRVYGAGITIAGAALRAFKTVGVLPAIMEQGCCTDGLDICLANGTKISHLPSVRVAGDDIPGTGGIMRPILARILSEATRASGTSVRLGVTFTSIKDEGAKVDVTFSDGTRGRYDLVVGADGVNSKVREQLFPDAPKPRFTGQGSWRAVVPRPPEVVCATMYIGKTAKAGINPVSRDEMYMFFLDKRDRPDHIGPEAWPATLREALAEFSGPIGAIRDGITPESRIVYRPLFALLLPKPWYRGRVVLIGDAAHSTTPHLASGAGISVEDALVLVEELERSPQAVELALQRFTDRRFERCRMVVENSVRLGEIERTGGSPAEHEKLMRDSMAAILAPI
jgi:2-polyprenyl-6-methoxyphenol hydroxylase-like FAD-dependent oxidoreductase